MGVSRQTILQRLKDGKLEGIRAHTGRRVSWRIRLFEKVYEDQRALFDENVFEVKHYEAQ